MSEFSQTDDEWIVVAVIGGVDDGMFTADVGLRGVRRTEVDHGDRLLRIKSPIQHADNGFHDKLDDDRPARRTEHRVERTSTWRLACGRSVEAQRGCHGTARSLTGLDSVGYRSAVGSGGFGREV